jgi:hypothetical protein
VEAITIPTLARRAAVVPAVPNLKKGRRLSGIRMTGRFAATEALGKSGEPNWRPSGDDAPRPRRSLCGNCARIKPAQDVRREKPDK